ncbi:hypothetical protein H6P81_007051 [Aristolochia fimbriata]|uniref:Pentatricopeptide repeat-containing protein n=1 Tax=Aristolochia fimbriata TaxID=158543 RepID=A0AAV7EZ89_ARIFI|nr:hypothetical protein H6P81_007051 [Aristolochia fimbriata]
MLPRSTTCLSHADCSKSLAWRSRVQKIFLVTQISSLILQRKNWPLLIPKTLALTPDIFLQILAKIQCYPEISLKFFNFATNSLPFQPDLRCQSKLIQILIQSNCIEQAKTFIKPLMKSVSVSALLDAFVRHPRGITSGSLMFNFLLQVYSENGSVCESIEIFKTRNIYKWVLSLSSCKALLAALWHGNQTNLVRPCYAMALRGLVAPDLSMWSVLVRLHCTEGKPEKAITLLKSGISSPGLYNFVIEYYSKKGELEASITLLNEMSSRGFVPGFGTHSSILDGACKFQDEKAIETIVDDMVEKKLLPNLPGLDYNEIITKFCALGKAFAAEMFFNRAIHKTADLRDSSYLGLLKVFCKEGRVKEAMKVYGLILEKGIKLNFISKSNLVSVLCQDEPSEQSDSVLENVIRSGFIPSGTDLSKYLASLCNRGNWAEAEKILNLIFDSGSLPDDTSCCSSLVAYYCSHEQLDLAISLHDKMAKFGQCLDVTTYNILLDSLCAGRRMAEASKVFDHMASRNIVNADCFSTMITALCAERDMKKAMKFHDEMMKKGLKPDEGTYKRLISGFMSSTGCHAKS